MPKKAKKPRESGYSRALVLRVCELISHGSSLRQAAVECGTTLPTFLRWVRQHEWLADHYARAREECLQYWADEILEIADDGRNDTYTDEEGNERVNHDHIQRSRLRVDSRKWILSKLQPKVYGDKLAVETRDRTLEDLVRDSGLEDRDGAGR